MDYEDLTLWYLLTDPFNENKEPDYDYPDYDYEEEREAEEDDDETDDETRESF